MPLNLNIPCELQHIYMQPITSIFAFSPTILCVINKGNISLFYNRYSNKSVFFLAFYKILKDKFDKRKKRKRETYSKICY